jgi:DNA-binding transcriptional LysR family regulator
LTKLIASHKDLDARLMSTDRVVRVVDEGVDCAVRIADLTDSSLHALKIGDVRRLLVASPDYLTVNGAPKTVAALYDHAHIVFDNFAPEGEWKFGGPGRPTVRVKPRLLLNDVAATIGATVAGAGIARLLSYQVAEELADGRLIAVLDEFAPPPVPVHLVFPANRQRSPNLRAFLEAVRLHFRERPLV